MIEHKNVSIAEQVFENLEKDILSGKFERGDVLTEMKLSEMLGVSRTPVREALRRLEQERIIEVSPKGAVVIGISKDDIDMIYEIRMRTEGIAARLAAEKSDEKSVKELSDILELQEFYTTKSNADSIKNADSDFHRALYRLSGSLPLSDCLESLHKKVVKYRKASVSDHSRADESLKEHKGILEAVKNHDADLAEALTLLHIENARKSIQTREDN